MLRQGLKAVVKRKIPAYPFFINSSKRFTFENKKYIVYAVQRQYQLGASIRPLEPLHEARADKA